MALKIQDLIDIEQFQLLQERLNEIYSFPSSIIDNDGNILTATAWQDICNKFHRQNPECEKECIKSDQYILSHLHEANPAVSYQCPHGLIDNATPIIIEGVHYGNYFTGQFFLEPPDMDFFKSQAKKYDFDEATYLEAVRKVPIWTREQLNNYLFFIKELIKILSAIGLKNMREIEARKKIEESEERSSTILGNIKEGFWITTPQGGKIVYINDAFCKILGYSREEMLKMSVSDVEANYTQADIGRTMQQVIQDGSANFESKFRHKDGSIIDMDVSVTYLPKQHLFFGLHRDISKLKKYAIELKRNKQTLELTLRAAGAGTWSWDMTTQMLDWSRDLYILLGLDPNVDQATFETWDRVLYPDDKEKAYARINQAIKERLPLYNEYRVVHPGGKIRWINAIGNTTYDESGQAILMIGICTDITARKNAEEALRESERKYRSIYDHAIEGIFQTTPEGRYSNVNSAFASMAGYGSPDEMISEITNIGEQLYVNPEDHKRLLLQMQTSEGTVKEFETQIRRKDGTLFWISLNVRLVNNEVEKTTWLEGKCIDITERKKAEEEKRRLEERIQRSEKMESLGTLAGGVAHDLNNVLGIIVGYAEMALESTDKSSPQRRSLENIMNGGLKAAAIVEDLLTLARRGVQGRAVLNLNTIVRDCQKSPEFLELSSRYPAVNISTDLEPDLLNIYGSAVHLGKSLYNLVSNACEAMPKGGTVTIRTTSQYLDKPIQGYDHIHCGNYVVISLSDNGEGISEHDTRRIFEPFYTKKIMGRSGTGLGLAVVWGTVKDHNGYIDVQSEEGKGSIFTLYFPVIRDEVTKEATAIPTEEYMGKYESILVVDDVQEQIDLTASLLTNLNYNVSTVSSGEEALAYLKEHEADLIILDMIMDPGMDGLDTYKSILEIRPKQKAIIVSGFSESDRVIAARKLGAGTYVRKPYIKEKLGLAVRKELDGSARTEGNQSL